LVSCAHEKNQATADLLTVEKQWAAATANNDVQAIERFIADDWVIVDADGNPIDRAKFLGVIRSGTLVHQSMELGDMQVRVYDDAAIVTGPTSSSGKYAGQAFATHEWSTDVFIRRDGVWRCVFSQLTSLPKK
jgi:ketosteroid isomerase-like protein